MATAENKVTRTWQEIAAEAAKETDGEKLLALAEELNRALAERDKLLHKTISPSKTSPEEGGPNNSMPQAP